MNINDYPSTDAFDEMFAPDGSPRPWAAAFVKRLAALPDGDLQQRQRAAEISLENMGITFNVYGHAAGTEKVWPFDLVPRIIEGNRSRSGQEIGVCGFALTCDVSRHERETWTV